MEPKENMKLRTMVACALTALILPLQAEENAAVKAEKYYQHGVAAVKRGDATTARRSFGAALRLDPGHANARYQLMQLKGSEGKLAGRAREIQLGKVTLPEVQFEDASLAEVLEALDMLVRKQTKDQFSPNFVIQDSSGELAEKKVNIRLRNVPAKVILQYALDQARALARYDAHAVLIRPAGAPSPKPAAKPKDEFPGIGG